MQGFYCKITYTGEYGIQYKDESGKKTLPIAAEKLNGKWSFLAGDNITIEYDESLFAEGASLYGSFAYFKYLIESGYFA